MSSRAKRKLEAKMRGGAEMALLNAYALRTSPMRMADRDWYGLPFTEPPGGMPTLESVGPGYFTINTSSYDLWDATTYDFAGPGKPVPIRNAGTKARAVRLRGMVGVLQDQWHQAGVWPWLDGRKCVRKPWEPTMEGLLASIERQGQEQHSRPLATRRNVPPGMENRYRIVDVNRDTSTITIAAANPVVTGITITDTFDSPFVPTADMVVSLAPVPTAERKKHRYTPPPRRLDGRR